MAQTKPGEKTVSQWLSLEHELALLVCLELVLLLVAAYHTTTVYWVGGWLLLLGWLIGIGEAESN